jgi:predicted nucleic acid-binding protein
VRTAGRAAGRGRATSYTTDRTFVDSNIIVYSVDQSPAEQAKHEIAVRLLSQDPDRLVISTQVLQEFYVVVTRKLAHSLDEERAARAVRALTKLDVVGVDSDLVLAAVETSRNAKISLRDSLIVEAARTAGCGRLLSEDMSAGQTIRGVTIENPFLTDPNEP